VAWGGGDEEGAGGTAGTERAGGMGVAGPRAAGGLTRRPSGGSGATPSSGPGHGRESAPGPGPGPGRESASGSGGGGGGPGHSRELSRDAAAFQLQQIARKPSHPELAKVVAVNHMHHRSASFVSLADEDCCPTCFEEYSGENPKMPLVCGHHFHLAGGLLRTGTPPTFNFLLLLLGRY